MSDTSVIGQRRRTDPQWKRRRSVLFGAAVLGLTFACIASILTSYLAFKYPIKWDRYQHPFSEHVGDRAMAYVQLFRSPFRRANAAMTVESILQIVHQMGDKYGVAPCLVAAVVTFESGFNPNTITTTGAMGLMALQPDTAKMLNVQDAFDPQQNVDGGARLLQQLSTVFNGDVRLVLAGYNAGPGAVRRHNGVPRFRETQDYANQVGAIYELCRAQPALFFASEQHR